MQIRRAYVKRFVLFNGLLIAYAVLRQGRGLSVKIGRDGFYLKLDPG